jgi:hypothetical protein
MVKRTSLFCHFFSEEEEKSLNSGFIRNERLSKQNALAYFATSLVKEEEKKFLTFAPGLCLRCRLVFREAAHR